MSQNDNFLEEILCLLVQVVFLCTLPHYQMHSELVVLGNRLMILSIFLVETKQTYWQILPLTTTSYGDSPYQSFSAIAGNTHFIDFDLLTQMGLLKEDNYASVNFGDDPTSVDYDRIFSARRPILETAVKKFFYRINHSKLISRILRKNNRLWLDDFVEFMAIKEHFGNQAFAKMG